MCRSCYARPVGGHVLCEGVSRASFDKRDRTPTQSCPGQSGPVTGIVLHRGVYGGIHSSATRVMDLGLFSQPLSGGFGRKVALWLGEHLITDNELLDAG